MSSNHQAPQWLNQATFYEIYPQSFADSNADGIGDIPGIIEHLDYLLQLGCNAIWLNPLYESPFRDAGYDISDYTKVAARYGTNDDLASLFEAAHARGMRAARPRAGPYVERAPLYSTKVPRIRRICTTTATSGPTTGSKGATGCRSSAAPKPATAPTS